MPNYDLGTAHGRIKIDADTRGADQAERAMADMAAEAKASAAKIEQLEDALYGFEEGSGKASRGSKLLDKDLLSLYASAQKVQKAVGLLAPSLLSLYRTTDRFKNKAGFSDFLAATPKIFLLRAALNQAKNSFFGINKAVDGLGQRSKILRGYAQNVLFAAGAYGAFKKFGGPIVDLTKKLTGANRIYRELIGTAAGGQTKLAKSARGLLELGLGIKKAGRSFDGSVGSIARTAGGLVGLTTGIALAKKGFGDFIKPFTLLNKLPAKVKAIGAATLLLAKPLAEVGAKGLIGFSNLIAGLASGIKQLAGGALVIPGIIASIGAVKGTVKILGSGLKSAFGDILAAGNGVFDTTANLDDFNDALGKLPANLQPTAKAVFEVKKNFDELSKSLVDTFIQGGTEDAAQLGKIIKGPLTGSTKGLTKELQQSRSKLIDFLGESGTLTGMNKIFDGTRQTVGNVTKALIPAGRGFVTLAADGAKFIASMTGGLPAVAEKLNGFIQANSENGNLTKWMQGAVDGAKQLVRGLLDVGRTVGTVLTLFKSKTGDNFLESFAKSAKKLRDATAKSANGGLLSEFSDKVRGAGTEKLERLIGLVKDFYSLRKAFSGAFDDLSEAAFSGLDVAVSLLKIMLPILQGVVSALTFLTPAIAIVLGLGAAFKVLLVAISPVKGAIVAVAGALTALYSGTKLLAFLAVLEKLGPIGRAAASGILTVATAAATVLAGFAAAAVVIGGFYLAIRQGQKDIDAANDAFKESQKVVSDYGNALHQAFTDDGGLAGKNVFTATEEAVKHMNDTLQKQIDTTPGFLATLTDSLNVKNASVNDPGKTPQQKASAVAALRVGLGPEQSDNVKELKSSAENATKAKEAFDKLGISTSDLAGVIQGSQSDFDNLKNSFKPVEGGDQAVAQLEALRAKFNQTQADFAKAGPSGAAYAAAIAQLGDAGADATSKLQGLKSALAALGLDQTSAIENAFNYAEAIKKIGDEAGNLVDQSAPLDNIFGADGLINPNAGANAKNLFNAVRDAVTGFQQAVLDGKDLPTEWGKITDSVPKLASAFHVTEDQINGLVKSVGGVPNIVDILVNIKGGDKVAADLAATVAKLQSVAPGAGITIPFQLDTDKDKLQAALNTALGAGVASVGDNNIEIPAGVVVDPAKLAQLQKDLGTAGIQTPGGPPPATPATVPVAPAVQSTAESGKPPPSPIAEPERAAADGVAPKAAAPDTSALDAMSAKYAELQKQFADLQANPPQIKVDASALAETSGAIDAAIAGFQKLKDGIGTAMAQAADVVRAGVAGILGPLQSLPGIAAAAGASIGQSFANGISAGIPAAVAAAEKLAAAVADRMPHSPAKKGPLSGKGYPLFAGLAVGDSFATGIGRSTPGVIKATDGMAGGVKAGLGGLGGNAGLQGSALDAPGSRAGEFLGQLKGLSDFGKQFVDVAKQISDAVFGFAKFLSDPMGKGTFFGKSPGTAFGYKRDPNVSDAELAQKRLTQGQTKEKALNPEEQAKKDQQTADATRQAQVTAEAIDKVIAGDRVAPLSEEEKKALSKANSDADKAAGLTGKKAAAGTTATPLTPEQTAAKAAKSQGDFDAGAREQAASLSAYLDAHPEDVGRLQSGEITAKTQDQQLAELQKQTPLLKDAADVAKNTDATQEQSLAALSTVQSLIDQQGEATTPAAKQQKSALDSLSGTIKGNAGLTEGDNPIDQASGIAGQAAGVAGDIFKVVDSVIDAVGATKNIADTLTRGFESSEDVFKTIDDIQKYVKLAADVAGAVSSVVGVAAGIAGASGGTDGGAASGALSAVSQVAALVQAGLETFNAVVDLGQEAYHLIGSQIAPFLGMLAGGAGGPLDGDVKFLLDEQTGNLLTYSASNPQDKRTNAIPGLEQNANARDQRIGAINVYGGPGSDPRDNTRDMMFQVNAAGFAGATSG